MPLEIKCGCGTPITCLQIPCFSGHQFTYLCRRL